MTDRKGTGPKRDYQKENRANTSFTLRMLVLAYVLYLAVKVVSGYLKGEEGTSLPLTICAVVVLGGGSIALGIYFFRQWRQQRKDAELTEEEAAQLAESIAQADRENGLADPEELVDALYEEEEADQTPE